MVKILMGLIAAIVIAAGGFFGFERYTQHRVAGEVEAAFEQIRAAGGKASHGKVSFDLKTRTVTIADIAAESAAPIAAQREDRQLHGLGHQSARCDAIRRRYDRSLRHRVRHESWPLSRAGTSPTRRRGSP